MLSRKQLRNPSLKTKSESKLIDAMNDARVRQLTNKSVSSNSVKLKMIAILNAQIPKSK